MIQFTQSSIIIAPVEKVFALIADPNQIPLWRNYVLGIREVSGSTQTGTTFLEEVHFMGKKNLLMKVTEFIPNKKMVIEAQSGMSMLPTQSFTFSPDGNKTCIEITVIMKVSGFFRLMDFMLPGQLKKIWAKYFDNLNQLMSK